MLWMAFGSMRVQAAVQPKQMLQVECRLMYFLERCAPQVYIRCALAWYLLENVRFVLYIRFEQDHAKEPLCPQGTHSKASMTLGDSYAAMTAEIK